MCLPKWDSSGEKENQCHSPSRNSVTWSDLKPHQLLVKKSRQKSQETGRAPVNQARSSNAAVESEKVAGTLLGVIQRFGVVFCSVKTW
mmetsp:Transcript_4919/g.31475  ORF Transcript_4919/g.31475 Transcript_4919/m.31475 type:complete len:88 (+) Transcript_4919:869-1132(+)